jgi:hypothetical protein
MMDFAALASPSTSDPSLSAAMVSTSSLQLRRCGPRPCLCSAEEREDDREQRQRPAQPAGPRPNRHRDFVTVPLRSPSVRRSVRSPDSDDETAVRGHTKELVLASLRSPGEQLSADLRHSMEGTIGADLSGVRVHRDGLAAQSAAALDAHAYTLGTDVVFGAGQFRPDTGVGRRMLAHELTHVAQQRGAKSSSGPLLVGRADDPAETQAHAVAHGQHSGAAAAPARNVLTVRRQVAAQDESAADAGPLDGDEEGEEEVADGDSPSGSGLAPVGEEPEESEDQDEEQSGIRGGVIQMQPRRARSGQPRDPGQRRLPRGSSRPPVRRRITSIDVNLSSQRLMINWDSGSPTGAPISSGRGLPNTTGDPCANPNVNGSNCTPTGTFSVGKRGGADYRNSNGDRMSWYVEFESARAIGIHDSQLVTGAPASHGCVRVSDPIARLINQSVTSRTVVNVTGKAPTRAWRSRRRRGRRSGAGRARRP